MRKVKEVMTSPVKSVESGMPIPELVSFFKVHNISGAPVMNEQGFPIGLISRSDLFREENPGGKTVKDVMTPFVFEISPEEDLMVVAKNMVDAKVHRIVVIEDGKAVGIVTSLDLVSDYVAQMALEGRGPS